MSSARRIAIAIAIVNIRLSYLASHRWFSGKINGCQTGSVQLEPSLVRSVSPGFDSRTVQPATHRPNKSPQAQSRCLLPISSVGQSVGLINPRPAVRARHWEAEIAQLGERQTEVLFPLGTSHCLAPKAKTHPDPWTERHLSEGPVFDPRFRQYRSV